MKVAFTMDDLPRWPHSEPPEGYTVAGVVEDIVAALERNGIEGVYAFANSWSLEPHPADASLFDMWLDAGHHVANHTHSHPELHVSTEAYIAEIDRAEELLDPWLSRAPRWFFRHTLNDWGDTEEKVTRVKTHLDERGYTVSEVTTFFHEWDWGRAFRAALSAGDEPLKDQLKKDGRKERSSSPWKRPRRIPPTTRSAASCQTGSSPISRSSPTTRVAPCRSSLPPSRKPTIASTGWARASPSRRAE